MLGHEDLERAQAEAKRLGISIGAALIKLELVDEAELTAFLARQYGVPAIDLTAREIPGDVSKVITKDVALRLLAIPIERAGSVLIVAMADPSNFYAVEELERLVQLDLEVVVSSEPAIRSAIERHYPA